MRIEQSERLRRIPPYLFAGIEDKVAQMRARGEEIYDLSIGDPDLPTPPEIVKVLQSAMAEKENQGYSPLRSNQSKTNTKEDELL